jgi:hypothetical protein
MKYCLAILVSFFILHHTNAQKIDTTTTFEWDTTTHQFNNNAQQVFTYNGACYLTRYVYSFWDSTSLSYKKYYRTTNSLFGNNATSQSLTQLWDEVVSKWENYEKGIYTYTTNPMLASSILYQSWQTSNVSWVNSRLYNYTYDANGNTTNILTKDWKAGAWVNSSQYTYTYNINNLMITFLQEIWDASTNNWINYNLINYAYTTFNKLSLDSGQKWNKPSSSWINNYKSLYTYDANNFLIKWNYNTWDTTVHNYLQSQQFQYINDATGNTIETLTLNFNGSIWDTLYKDVNHYNGCILPVDLISFGAIKDNKTVKLNWQTGSEINLSHFNIQRSTDGNHFENIGVVKATNQIGNQYRFNNLLTIPYSSTTFYYRLEIVDKDGIVTYSEIKKVEITNEQVFIKVYPNPATNDIKIDGKNICQICLKDITGRILHKQVYRSPIGSTQLKVSNIAIGILFLEIQTLDGILHTQKVIIQ